MPVIPEPSDFPAVLQKGGNESQKKPNDESQKKPNDESQKKPNDESQKASAQDFLSKGPHIPDSM
jgi:hypothetical protein